MHKLQIIIQEPVKMIAYIVWSKEFVRLNKMQNTYDGNTYSSYLGEQTMAMASGSISW